MSYIRIILARLFIPISHWLMILRCRDLKYGCHKFGNCCFYGSPEFLAICSEAMRQLSVLDESLYESVLKDKLMLWFEPEGMKVFFRFFGVPESFVAWKEQGLIACIVYAHFSVKLLNAPGPALKVIMTPRHIMRKRMEAPVRLWLEQHNFPPELADCFNPTAPVIPSPRNRPPIPVNTEGFWGALWDEFTDPEGYTDCYAKCMLLGTSAHAGSELGGATYIAKKWYSWKYPKWFKAGGKYSRKLVPKLAEKIGACLAPLAIKDAWDCYHECKDRQ